MHITFWLENFIGRFHLKGLGPAADWDKNSALAFSNTPAHLLPHNGFLERKLSFENIE
jgi:hypothetical protein